MPTGRPSLRRGGAAADMAPEPRARLLLLLLVTVAAAGASALHQEVRGDGATAGGAASTDSLAAEHPLQGAVGGAGDPGSRVCARTTTLTAPPPPSLAHHLCRP